MVHLRRQVEIGLAWADPVQFDRVLMRDQGVLLPMQEENRALRLRDQVNVPEALVDNYGEEAGPAEEAPRRILN